MSTTLRAMQPVVSIVSKVEDVHLHTRLFPKERLPSDDFGVQVQTHGLPGCDASAGEGHECLCSSHLYWMGLRGLGWKRLLLRSDNERALLAFLRAAGASLEGVEVIEQASLEGDHAANGLAEVGVREVKAQTRVLKSHLKRDSRDSWIGVNHWQRGWFDTQQIACQGTEFKLMGKRLISDAQESAGGFKLSNLERTQHSYRSPHVVKVEWQVMRRE